VVGGMSWAITASGVPVEVEVEFAENSKIGEKILISEQIVSALVEMACPFQLKPHQIQGLELNCFPLFPIVQWLVKSVIDRRRLTGDSVRNYSQFVFGSMSSNKRGNVSLSRSSSSSESGREYLVQSVASKYRLKRLYSKQQHSRFAAKDSFVDATLLEYAFHFRAHSAFGALNDSVEDQTDGDGVGDKSGKADGDKSGGNKLAAKYGDLMAKMDGDRGRGQKRKDKDDAKQMDHDDDLETAEQEEQRLKQLRGEMMEEEALRNVTGSALVGIIDRDAVQSGKGNYEEEDVEREALLVRRNDKEFVYNQRKKKLQDRYHELSADKKANIDRYKTESDKMETLDAKMQAITHKNSKIKDMIDELAAQELKVENQEILAKLKALVMENEAMKRKQEVFKAECMAQQKTFRANLESLEKAMAADDDDAESQRILKMEKLHANDLAKHDKIRQLLAAKNQELSVLSRKLESYPTRSELLQYEKRFVELYNVTNDRLKETKKYFHLYNSLNDGNESMLSEVNLLQKIQTEFPKRSQSAEDRTAFIEALKKMIDSLRSNAELAASKLEDVKKEKDRQSGAYNELLNYQRKYYGKVKEFQNACNLNSQLTDRIDIVEAKLKEIAMMNQQ